MFNSQLTLTPRDTGHNVGMIQVILMYSILMSIKTIHTACPLAFIQTNFVLRNHVISSSVAQSINQCQRQCASHMECNSINFYASQSKCELNKATHLSNPVDLSYEVLSTYMIYDERPMLTCSDSLCSTDHTCLTISSSVQYRCKECATAFGMESKVIPDSAISASSSLSTGHAHYRARLHNWPAMPFQSSVDSAAWLPSKCQIGEYLQVDIGRKVYVTKIATQGRPYYSGNQYVTKYKLKYRENDGSTWKDYLEGNAVKEFVGNSDRDTVVTHRLKTIEAQFIRFVVLAWNNYIVLRVEIYGCSM